MSVVSTIGGKNKDGARSASLVVFAVDETTAHDLAQSIGQLGVTDAYVARGDIDTAISHLSRVEKSPQRLIVDISGESQPLLALDRLAEACDPSVQVYVLGESNDVTLYRSLLQAGVRDYRYKPLTVDALRGWLGDQDGSLVRKARSGKIIAVTGTRGGVGVTSVAACLASQLTAGKGLRRIAYLDLDFYGGTGSTLLGMSSNHALPEVLQNIERIDPQFLERTLTSKDGRLFVLAANQNYSDAFSMESGMMGRLLAVLSQHFHYVVIDLHNPGGTLANEVFSHADMACLLSDRSVHSARVLTRLLLHIEARQNPPALHVLLNSSRSPVKGRVGAKEFAQAISRPVALDIPYDGKLPGLAEDLGEPLAAGSELAKAVNKLTRMLTGELAQGGAAAKVARWFRRSA
ncbi:pilus assembly protein CpaE [Alcaligenaceae bacterium]|nr:pilus assembly protein CpaE [Alcaligenaceae bacterium]